MESRPERLLHMKKMTEDFAKGNYLNLEGQKFALFF
jgi:hypothetical protein